ncbi:MAG: hypothetical protein ACXVLZ_12755 [Acidimicrobiia bacterium]
MIHRLELVGDGVRGHVELEQPEAGPVRYELPLAGDAVGPGFVVVRDDALARPRGRVLELRGEGIWTEMVCETEGEHWSFGLEAFGLRVDDPAAEIGERLPVGYDLEWETPDHVHGELLIGRGRIPVDCRGGFTITP